jgi:hypothetical protein
LFIIIDKKKSGYYNPKSLTRIREEFRKRRSEDVSADEDDYGHAAACGGCLYGH